MQSKMTGHGAGSSKRAGTSRVQPHVQLNPEVQVLANLGEEHMSVSNSSCSTSSSSNFGEADSDGEAEVDSHSEPEAGSTMGAAAGGRHMYSPLDGGSDSDSELELDDAELFCEEALALLAHEIVCCDCDSDVESEEDGEEESESEIESADGDNLSHSTYQLMFSEEDEEEDESVGNGKKDECPFVVESVLLLEEDQESEEKSDPTSGDSLGNAQ
ncbi:clumping factor A [Drosophila kikkawai]|uniref:Clumping factor A n=1 Tax=Drosophila kikkawai TaxID=30033 RepID=A0A6P4IJS5_DROKI|nr:putative uncharacterized protein YGR160W [Drosophila kikkawai]